MEVLEQRCDECGRPPRRLPLTVDGLLFCQRNCYLAHFGRIWDRLIASIYSPPKLSKQKLQEPELLLTDNDSLRIA